MKRLIERQPKTLLRNAILSAMVRNATQEAQGPQRSISPATPLAWQRYVDSRMKQFGAAR
ncbi:MAG: hypothetical protein ACM359_07395 [Bacillota bacterium]